MVFFFSQEISEVFTHISNQKIAYYNILTSFSMSNRIGSINESVFGTCGLFLQCVCRVCCSMVWSCYQLTPWCCFIFLKSGWYDCVLSFAFQLKTVWCAIQQCPASTVLSFCPTMFPYKYSKERFILRKELVLKYPISSLNTWTYSLTYISPSVWWSY